MPTKITTRTNGPLLVEGDGITVCDQNGKPYTPAERCQVRAVPLRRLGQQALLRRHALEERVYLSAATLTAKVEER